MKILLIYPSKSKLRTKGFDFSIKNTISWRLLLGPQLAFQMLAAVTPREHSIHLVDERSQKIDFHDEYDLVGVSSITPSATRSYEIADTFRSLHVPVILGGWHPSALPEEAKQHADAVVIGEAEECWPSLLKDVERKKIKPFYEAPVDLANIPPAERKKIQPNRRYFIEQIQATRGCTMRCRFCSISNSKYECTYRLRPINHVIEELKSIPQKIIYFSDPSMTINPEYTKQLFRAMKQLNKKFSCNGSIGVLSHDDELITLASEAGCREWDIGFESVSQESLNLVGKTSNKVEEFASTIEKIHDSGTCVKANFMFGFDADKPDIFDKTIDAIYEWDIDLVDINILTPFPGTPLYEDLEREKRILTKDWSQYDLKHVVFQPKNMSAQDLFAETMRVHRTVYSTSNIFKRAITCLTYSPYNFFTTGLQNFFM
jgi:radical SAM superfamily enzyme YgiQ (UPF0313 family)